VLPDRLPFKLSISLASTTLHCSDECFGQNDGQGVQ